MNRGRSAFGDLQPDGTYTLKTMKDGDGVSPGLSRVTVSGTGPNPKRELVPRKYTQMTTSKLEAVVSPEKTEFDFDLK
ncbi:MAG: hypothetical protein P4L84_26160 [Isosphaeraceae bacterium]|nr:hypothetical protein [Isosphaeraceae bacterium]